jgi:mannose-6-phosphate isomerase-like protein (cupin superfamily)
MRSVRPDAIVHGRVPRRNARATGAERGPEACHYAPLLSPRILPAGDAFWRPSNQMGVLNTDLATQLQSDALAARIWLLEPRQASTKHRHATQTELYVVLEGSGRLRIGDDVHSLERLSSALIEPEVVRQLFNDTTRTPSGSSSGPRRSSRTRSR